MADEFVDPLSFRGVKRGEQVEEEDEKVTPQPVVEPKDNATFVSPLSVQPPKKFVSPIETVKEPVVEPQQTVEDPGSFDDIFSNTFLGKLSVKATLLLADNDFSFSDVAKDIATDTVAGGVEDAVVATMFRAEQGFNETLSFLYSKNLLLAGQDIPTALGETGTSALQQESVRRSLDASQGLEELLSDPSVSTSRAVVRDISRFAIPYLLFRRAAGGKEAGFVRRDIVAGGLADLAAFSTDEGRLSSIVSEADIPGVSKFVDTYLATDPDDETATAVLKQGLEGSILVAGSDLALRSIIKIFSLAKSVRSQNIGASTGKTSDTAQLPGTRDRSSVLEEADAMAAEEAELLLSQKVRIRPGDDPAEVAANLFREKLQERGIWDAFDEGDQAAKLQWFFNRSQKVHGEGGKLLPPPTKATQGEHDKWQKDWEANVAKVERIKKEQAKVTPKKVLDALDTRVWDRAGPFRSILEKTPEGQVAAERFALSRGASTYAALLNTSAVRGAYREKVTGLPVWKSINKEKRDLVDEVRSVRTFRHIKVRKPDWSEKGNPLTRKSAGFFSGQLEDIEKRVGAVAYQDAMKRTDHYFATVRTVLDQMDEGGLFLPGEKEALARWQHSPIRYIEELDQPIAEFRGADGKPISVSSSGILPLGKGAEEAIESDGEMLLQEIILRGVSRAARNRANLALLDAAETDLIPILKTTIPTGESVKDWVTIKVMDSGEVKEMVLAREYAEMWAGNPETMGTMLKMVRNFSGAPAVRFFATGPGNPEFGFTNFPRDITFGLLTSNLYSAFLPRAVMQWGEDFKEVWKDVVFQKGEYLDYIKEGGGMELLTHQGIPGHSKPGSTALKDLADAFAYTNTTSEMMNRIIFRHRALKNRQKEMGPDYVLTREDKEHATFIARDIMDFDKGGAWSKALNEGFPYFNPAVLGMGNYARSYKRNPAKAGAYAAQLLGIYAAVHVASRAINPEAHDDVPDVVQNLYFTITTPWGIVDQEGDTRHLYFKVPIDHSTVGLKVAADAAVRAWHNKGLPNEKEVSAIGSFGEFMDSQFGIVPGISVMPPTVSAAITLGANFNWWRQSPAWTGERGIMSKTEFTEDTPEIFRDIANIAEGTADLSPTRMEQALQQVLPDNIFTDIMGAGYKKATEGLRQEELQPMQDEMIKRLREHPGARRFLGFTSPHGKSVEHIQEVSAEATSVQILISRQVDQFSTQIIAKVEGVTTERAFEWIKEEVPFEKQVNAVERLHNGLALDKVFTAINYEENKLHLPLRKWWKDVAATPPAARAKLLVEHISAMQNIDGDVQRREAKKVIAAMMLTVPGFNPGTSDEFAISLKRELELFGIPPKEFFK